MMSTGCMFRNRLSRDRAPRRPKPYCQCKPGNPVPWKLLNVCQCGEEEDAKEWKWECPENNSWMLLSEDQKTVTFHPFYSSGTASVRGDMPMLHNYHYYWEVKMLSDTYGTDIMVGMCSDKAVLSDSQFEFKSLLGQDSESYGLSYKGEVRHSAGVTRDSAGFCRGTIVGVRLDMWAGTMEFFINRKSQGVSFYNLRRHKELYPVVCSTAAQSSMRLIYAASWRASLQLEAVKVLHASLAERKVALPPGLWRLLKRQVWLNLPDDDKDPAPKPTEPDEAARAADVRVAKHPGADAGLPAEVADPEEDLWATPAASTLATIPDDATPDSAHDIYSKGFRDDSNTLTLDIGEKQNDEDSVTEDDNKDGASKSATSHENLATEKESASSTDSAELSADASEESKENSDSTDGSDTPPTENLSSDEQNNLQVVSRNFCRGVYEGSERDAVMYMSPDSWYSLPPVRYDPATALPLPCSLVNNT